MHFINVFAVLLCGWSAQSHYSVRRPCHLSWKRFTGHNLPRKDFFILKLQKRKRKPCYILLKNHQLSLRFPAGLSVACMYRGPGMLLARYRPLSAWWERKRRKTVLVSTFSFLDLFESSSWDWEWHQRLKSEKEFSFPHSKSVPHQASPPNKTN